MTVIMHSVITVVIVIIVVSVLQIYLAPQVDFKISQLAVSGLRVNRLDLYGEVRAKR